MGVRGLTKAVTKDMPARVRERVSLQDLAGPGSFVCVDGGALLHTLARKLPWGAHEALRERCREFAGGLLAAGLAVVVVFDGLGDPAKTDTFRERHEARITDADSCARARRYPSTANGFKPLPAHIARDVRQTLRDLDGVEVVVAPREADDLLAFRAHHQQCVGVLSTDSDFIVYDVPALLQLDSLQRGDDGLLSVCRVQRRRVAEALGIQPDLMWVLATVMGTDLVTPAPHWKRAVWGYWHSLNVGQGASYAHAVARMVRDLPKQKLLQSLAGGRNSPPEAMQAALQAFRTVRMQFGIRRPAPLAPNADCEIAPERWEGLLARFRGCTLDSDLLTLLCDVQSRDPILLERAAEPSAAAVVEPLLRRVLGLVAGQGGPTTILHRARDGRGVADKRVDVAPLPLAEGARPLPAAIEEAEEGLADAQLHPRLLPLAYAARWLRSRGAVDAEGLRGALTPRPAPASVPDGGVWSALRGRARVEEERFSPFHGVELLLQCALKALQPWVCLMRPDLPVLLLCDYGFLSEAAEVEAVVSFSSG